MQKRVVLDDGSRGLVVRSGHGFYTIELDGPEAGRVQVRASLPASSRAVSATSAAAAVLPNLRALDPARGGRGGGSAVQGGTSLAAGCYEGE
jgi:hypothetical protein